MEEWVGTWAIFTGLTQTTCYLSPESPEHWEDKHLSESTCWTETINRYPPGTLKDISILHLDMILTLFLRHLLNLNISSALEGAVARPTWRKVIQ